MKQIPNDLTPQQAEYMLETEYNQVVPKNNSEALVDYMRKVLPVEVDGYDLQVVTSPATTAIKVRYSKSKVMEDTADDLVSFGDPVDQQAPFMYLILWLFMNDKANVAE